MSCSTSTVRARTTSLVVQILNLEKPLELESIKWGGWVGGGGGVGG